ncbi:hypothetical protein ACNKHO_14840 [Shigella flexneri]
MNEKDNLTQPGGLGSLPQLMTGTRKLSTTRLSLPAAQEVSEVPVKRLLQEQAVIAILFPMNFSCG